MRAAQTASRALGLNLTMDLPPDYTPLTLAEVFYMATMGGAKGTYRLNIMHHIPLEQNDTQVYYACTCIWLLLRSPCVPQK